MIARADLTFRRIAAVAALAAALGLAGCGRKAGLDPPPGAAASVSTPSPETPSLGAGGEPVEASPALGPDGKPVAPPPGQLRWFFLDWLIK